MPRLDTSKRAEILRCLVEGNSILSTTRITGAAKNTVIALLEMAGRACAQYQHDHIVNLKSKRIQLDEIWSFVGCKEGAKKAAKDRHMGDTWTWKCVDADTKLIVSWRVGDRGMVVANYFCADLAKRFTDHSMLQITSDGHMAYRWPISSHFPNAHYGQLVKSYRIDPSTGKEVCTGARKVTVFGQPDPKHISTSYVERSNLSLRMSNRRFTRLTNGYSKKIQNHCHMLAIGFMAFNFCRRHHTIKATPAQASGIADHQWSLDEVVEMVNDYAERMEQEAFEAAFAAKYSAPRTTPKSFTPVKPKLPWYLDKDSGGKPESP